MFTKKLRGASHAKPVHELFNFLSRVPSDKQLVSCPFFTGHLSQQNMALVAYKKMVIFPLSERAFYQLKKDTFHVLIRCSIVILWLEIDLNFFLFSLVFATQMI